MDDRGLGHGEITDDTMLDGGTQNILVRFERAGHRYVLRRPPLHKRTNSDDTMRKEAAVLRALAHTEVPHARLLAAEEELEPIGAAFYLMEAIDGVNPAVGQLPAPYDRDPTWRRDLGLSIVDAAARLAGVPEHAAELGGLRRHDDFIARQPARWKHQLDGYDMLEGYPGCAIDGVGDVHAWLEANLPQHARRGLMHGDFHLANVLADRERPAIRAVLDWELAAIGDPLLDLGWLLATWPPPGEPATAAHEPGRVGALPWSDFPTESELVDRYADAVDRDLDELPWFIVLACYKLAILLEGTYARACAGQADEATGDRLHAAAVGLFGQAAERISS